jgi:3-dehydrosphinganine reductase
MPKDLHKDFFYGKKALITGGSSGIGLALARQLAARGAHLWLAARDRTRLEAAAGELKAAAADPAQVIGFSPADVSDERQAFAAVQEADRGLGALDLIYNSAGITHPGYFQDLAADIFRRNMDVNYFGTLNICRAVVPEMIRRGQGHIINISSLVAIIAVYGYTAYAASKWAVRGLTDILRAELKPHGVRVSIAFPPDTDTPQLAFEAPIKPYETKVIASSNKVYSAEAVARDILRGTERNRYIILTGMDSTFFYWLSNLAGPLQYPIMDMLVADGSRKRIAAEAKNRTRV